jgi:hypothetical protein
MDTLTVDERQAFISDRAALLEAESPELDANPDDGRAGGFSDFYDTERINGGPVHAHCVQAIAKAVG